MISLVSSKIIFMKQGILITILIIFLARPVDCYCQANIQDSMALVDLYNATDGPNWTHHANWFSQLFWPNNVDQYGIPIYGHTYWEGVEMSASARITRFYKADGNLNGSVPSSFSNLSMLDTLYFGDNGGGNPNLTGSISSLGMLKYLSITGTGISTVSGLTNLEELYADACPSLNLSTLSSLGSLKTLSIQGCGLTSVPSSFLQLLNHATINVNYNQLNFDVTEQLANSPNFYFGNQEKLKILNKNNVLSIHAGGTLANNIYNWYKVLPNQSDQSVYEVQGDSTFEPTENGNYRALVFQLNHPQPFDLNSDTVYVITPNNGLDVNVIDPNPSAITANGSISNDGSKIDYSKIVTGAATDGVTKVLIIAKSNNPVNFYLDDPKNGYLNTLDNQNDNSKEINITVTPANGKAIAIYTVPDGIGVNTTMGQRDITIHAKDVSGKHSDPVLSLVSPPVVLVHGMWSDPTVWNTGGFTTALENSGLNPFAADYEAFNAMTFNPNNPASLPGRSAVKEAIDVGLYVFRSNNIAATQVDVVGHSLGGLMTRSLSQQPEFISIKNYYKGYVHKLITLGTPHKGSPFGPLLWNNKDKIASLHSPTTTVYLPVTLQALLKLSPMPIGTCHLDFGSTSDGINALTKTLPFWSYAIEGNYKGNGSAMQQTKGYIALDIVCQTFFNISLQSAMDSWCNPASSTDHDLIVPLKSEKGFIDKDTLFWGTAHSGPADVTETNNPLIQNKVIKLLLSDDTTQFSAGFPAPLDFSLDCNSSSFRNTSQTLNNKSQIIENKTAQADSSYFRITSPVSGATFDKTTITNAQFSYEAKGGLVPASALFLIKDIGVYAAPVNPPYTITVPIPASTRQGKLTVTLIVRDTAGNLFADTISMAIKTDYVLDEIFSDKRTINLDSSVRQSVISVSGDYIDPLDEDAYTTENLSYASTGTTYSSLFNSGIFTVSPDGLIMAKKPGNDVLIVTNSGQTLEIPVNIDSNIINEHLYANTIDFPAIPDKLLTDGSFSMGATSSSGEDVQYQLLSGNIHLDNGIVSIIDSGLVTIQALAGGTPYFDSAKAVTRSFRILNSGIIYTFIGNGNWNISSNWSNNTMPPAVLPEGAEIIIDPPINGECILNVSQTISKNSKLTVKENKKLKIVGSILSN